MVLPYGVQKFRRYGSSGSTYDPFAPTPPNTSNPHPGVYGPPPQRSPQQNPYQTGVAPMPGSPDDTGRSAGPMPSGYDQPDDTGPGTDMDRRVQRILSKYPGYKSIWDTGPTGQILGEMRTEYMGTDPTKWAQAQVGRQRLDESRLRDIAMGDVGSAQATAESNLAMRGGLSGGAQERLATTGLQTQANKLQELARGGMLARADIDVADEGRKFQGRSGLASAGMQDVGNMNQWDLDRARMEMEAMASGYTADALARNPGNPYANPRDTTATGLPDPIGAMLPSWAQNKILPTGANMFTDINAPLTNAFDRASGGKMSKTLKRWT